jgi:hypothetical protein
MGPRTGRGLGSCAQGFGAGAGYGCCGRRFYTRSEEKELLVESVKNLKEDLKAAEERLAEIKSE